MIYGEKMYNMVRRYNVAVMEVDVGQPLPLPVMMVVDKNRNAHDVPDTPTYALFKEAIDFGLVAKLYWMNISSHDEETVSHYCMYPRSIEHLLDALEIKVHHGLVGAAMGGIIEDTNMEMQVYFGSGDGHIESELHLPNPVSNYLKRQEEN
jgi:hypothetical protein